MRVEVLGGVERRRRWSRDDKMRIIEETLAPGAVVTEIARCGRSLAAATAKKISQAPAPFHAVARGRAGPSLLAMIMFEKFDPEPSGRALRPGRGADRALDHGRRGGIGLRGA